MQPSSDNRDKSPSKMQSLRNRLYRYSTVFSGAMLILSLISNLGTQIANRLGMGEGTPRTEASNGLLPYESPAFTVFSSNIFINDAKAFSLLGAPLGLGCGLLR